jgi:hypothetical protein
MRFFETRSGQRNATFVAVLAVASMGIIGTASALDQCNFDSFVEIKNDTGKTLTAVGVLHRYGAAADRGDTEQLLWTKVADKQTTSKKTVSSHANRNVFRRIGQGGRHDWWLVIYSHEQDGEDKVFRLYPHNLQYQRSQIQANLVTSVQTMASSQLKTIASGWTPGGPVILAVEPAIKVILGLLGDPKAPTLNNYTAVDLHCNDAGKTMTITIGNQKSLTNKNIITFRTPAKQKLVVLERASTLIKPAEIMEAVLKKLKEESPKKEDTGSNTKSEPVAPK